MNDKNKICPFSGMPCDKNKCFQISEIIDGVEKKFKLCEDCANAYLHKHETISELKGETPGKNISTKNNLINFCKRLGIPTTPKTQLEIIKCSGCNHTLLELKEMGKLNCNLCFQSFFPEIENYMYSTYGIPKDKQPQPKKTNKLIQLKEQLEILIQEEKFEEAKKVNNQIKELKSKVNEIRKIRKEIKSLIEIGNHKEAELLKQKLRNLIS